MFNVIDFLIIKKLHILHFRASHSVTVVAFKGINENLAFVIWGFSYFQRFATIIVPFKLTFIFLTVLFLSCGLFNTVAIEVPGGNRIRRINIKAQHSAFSRAINRTVS